MTLRNCWIILNFRTGMYITHPIDKLSLNDDVLGVWITKHSCWFNEILMSLILKLTSRIRCSRG